ncbi:MAG: XRE family transcriptional regulator [Candidatus Omnitrophota bacterium]
MLIGTRLKELRKVHDMSLTELSQKSGVQLATLSRIENLKMTGTLESHTKIAQALAIELTELYKDIETAKPQVEMKTAQSAMDIFTHNEKSSYEILTSNVLSKKMMPILLKIEPGGKTNPEKNQKGAEKFVFILEGKIDIRVGDQTYSLSRNNTLYFDASLDHWLENPGKAMARVICVGTPVAL